MNSETIKNIKKQLKLTKKQREIIIGKLLGDGHLESQNRGRTYRLKIEHPVKQKEYVEWLYKIFKDWTLTPPQLKQKEKGLNYWFQTVSHGSFRFYAQQFYKNGKKKIPKLIHRWLTPQALAIWFMDDGSCKDKKRKVQLINTQGFDWQDLHRLQLALERRYGIFTRLKKERGRSVIYVQADSVDKFVNLIKPYIIPMMRYKLPD